MTIRAMRLLALVGAATLAAACGDGTSSAEPREAFTADALAACNAHAEEQAEIFSELFADGQATLEEWAAAIPRYLPLVEDSFGQIAGLDPPVDLEGAFGDFMSAADEYLGLQRDGLNAARNGDQERFDEIETQAQGPVKERMIDASTALGFGECFE